MNLKIYLTAAVCLLCLSTAQTQTFNINTGSNIVITANGTYTISGNGSPTTHTIKVDSDVVADITLENVNIDVSGITNACAFDMTGATVTLRLSGTNTLQSGDRCAGLHAPEGATLTITSKSGDGSTNGTLSATGGGYAAGIGGSERGSGGDITISGGTVNATGNWAGAGIGGGYGGNYGGSGGYYGGNGGTITISGGTVNATGNYAGAGIGSGYQGHGGVITISGGFVTASAQNSTGDPAAIGGARDSDAGTITITGGFVVAIAGSGGALGGGAGNLDGSISISGGTVIATGRGIGFGNNGSTLTTITGAPVIFATAINGTASNPRNGIASGGDVGIDPSNKTITLNNNFTIPANVLLTIPEGWTLNHTGLTNNGSIINYGTFNPSLPLYTVSFEMNGFGTPIDPITNLVEGSDLAAFQPPAPTAEGCRFGGWYTDRGCTDRWNFFFDIVSSDITLYAKWTNKPQSITGFTDIIKTYGDGSFVLRARATSGLPVRYTIANPPGTVTVAEFSNDSTVTIRNAGAATITATQDGNAEYLAAASVPVTLTVNKANQSITGFLPWDTVVFPGAQISLSATGSSGLPVTYKSYDTTVARISGNMVTITALGLVTIVANQEGNNNYNPAPALTCMLIVNPLLVESVSLNKKTLNLSVGDRDTLIATVSPPNTNRSVTWEIADEDVVTFIKRNDTSCILIGASVGTAVVRVRTVDGGKTDSCTVTVNPVPVPVTGVSLNKNAVELSVGGSDTLIATVSPPDATNRNVTWISSGDAVTIESLNDTCIITGASVGTAVVRVRTADGGKTDSCRITVSKKPQSITGFNDITKTFDAEPFTLEAHATSGLPVSYTIENPPGIMVADLVGSNNSTVVIHSAGTATITAHQDGNDVYAATELTCTLTVIVPVTGVSLNKETLNLSVGGSDTLTAIFSPPDATNRNVTC
jgi:uncharacterized repeat protein (TIGR02543 family)